VNPILRELLGKYMKKIRMSKKLADVNYIILHNLTALPFAHHLKRITSAKVILYIHNKTSPPSLRKIFLITHAQRFNKISSCELTETVDCVITTSKRMQEYVYKAYGFKAHVIAPGCDVAPEPFSRKLRYILVPQRVSLGKRVHIVAKLLSSCSTSFYTIFAGSSHYTTSFVLRLISKSGLTHYKVVINPFENLLFWLYKHALCSVSIVGEPFGMYIIESVSQGTPVIASQRAGASELFVHNLHGFFFETKDEIPHYVDTLVSNPELAMEMGYEAWRICREKYTWHAHIKKLVEALKSCRR